MEAVLWPLFGLGLIVAFGYLGVQREAIQYKENSPPELPQLDELSRTGLERIWVENKRRIFKNTCTPSKHSNSYEQTLLLQNRQIEKRLLRIHDEVFSSNQIAKLAKQNCSQPIGSNVLSLRQDIDLSSLQDRDIASLAFFAYSETLINNSEHIRNEPKTIIRFTNHLLQKNYAPAHLLKGIILKYGFYPAQRPYSKDAKRHLESAQKAGISQAATELANISIHFELDDIRDGYNDTARIFWK